MVDRLPRRRMPSTSECTRLAPGGNGGGGTGGGSGEGEGGGIGGGGDGASVIDATIWIIVTDSIC